MKKIINNKTYNTETAVKLCTLHCRHHGGDFDWHDTGLYMTKKGAFFLAGHGNASSLWRERFDSNTYGSGAGVKPITKDAARKILEDQDEHEWHEKLFGPAVEAGDDDSETSILIRMPSTIRRAIGEKAKAKGVSVNQYCLTVLANN